ncbi:MAG: carboxyltransferase subunit alpha [Herbinix sp.]|nr:carboxyltransferase subunit alpha [Herbinix sp.]
MCARMNYRICKECGSEIDREVLDEYYSICPTCGNYLRVHAKKRIEMLADAKSFHEWDTSVELNISDLDENYLKKLKDNFQKHKLHEAVLIGEIEINGIRTAIGVMDTRFMMATMGHAEGEKVTCLFEKATKKKLSVIMFCCSGGARMQEGIISLMQMSKTAAAVKKHSKAGLLYLSVLTNPTMGGVTASFAMLADIILAEKEALIGFAGRRVIEQNIGEVLPDGFQSAEFQLEHGFIDMIVERYELKDNLYNLLKLHTSKKSGKYLRRDVEQAENRLFTSRIQAWERVKIARAHDRPTSKNYIEHIFENFVELRGDRVSEDDHAVIAGIAKIHGQNITVIGQEKGKKNLDDAIYRNWGMTSPSGYRKIMRMMIQAEKFGRPILCFVDTIGAACGKKAEGEGQGLVIAKVLELVSDMNVPIVSIIIGEACSGGALALSMGNEVWMLENSVYSILSPEGYASILWRDNTRAEEAAKQMKLEAKDLYRCKVIDKIISEKVPVTVNNMGDTCKQISDEIARFLKDYKNKSELYIKKERYEKYRKF